MSTQSVKPKITNVFVLMLENHSFDNMFALSGIPGIQAATTSDKNYYDNIAYPVQSGAPAQMPTDPGHEYLDVVEQLCGYGTWRHHEVGMVSPFGASLVEFNNALWVYFVEHENQRVVGRSVSDVVNWIDVTSKTGPSAAVFDNIVRVASIDPVTKAIRVSSSKNGINWDPPQPVNQLSPLTPALATFNSRLYLAFIANDPSNRILVCSSSDGQNWNGGVEVGQRSQCAPSLAVFGNQLQLAFVAEGSNSQFITSSGDGMEWSIYPPIDNSGFASNYATSTTEYPHNPPSADKIGDIMKCFDTTEKLPVIRKLATEFAICDHWFSSLPGPTWPNRFFLHGASSNGMDDSPTSSQIKKWEVQSSRYGFTFPNGSIFDHLTKYDHNWRIYNDKKNHYSDDPQGKWGGWPQVAAIHNIRLSGIKDLDTLLPWLRTIKTKEQYPTPYTFIEPNYGHVSMNFAGGSSQHPMDDTYGGEALISAVYDAIRNSVIWESSLLIIIYDEHGGYYDSVAPGPAPAPGDNSSPKWNTHGFDFTRFGARVPAVIVSPLIPKGTVDPTVYDHTSVLATLEQWLDMPPLTKRDAAANDLLHLLSLDSPRTDCPTELPDPVKSTGGQRAPLTAEEEASFDAQPLPRSGNLIGFLGVALKTELELSDGSDAEHAALIAKFEEIKTRGDAKAYFQNVAAKLETARASDTRE